jgi:hypothetical protein
VLNVGPVSVLASYGRLQGLPRLDKRGNCIAVAFNLDGYQLGDFKRSEGSEDFGVREVNRAKIRSVKLSE